MKLSRYVNGNTQKITSVNTAGEVNGLNIVLTVTIFRKNIGTFMIFWIERLLRRMTFKGSIQAKTGFGVCFSMWIPTKSLAQITLHHKYLRHVLNSLLTFFALYLMRVSPQILFQLLGKNNSFCRHCAYTKMTCHIIHEWSSPCSAYLCCDESMWTRGPL